MTFSKNLKQIRIKKGFSQKEIAERLGVSQPSYAQYENGKRNPKLETIQKIAHALDVNPLVLIGQISETLSDDLRAEPNIEKAYFDIFKYIYGKIDIVQEKDHNGFGYNYILGNEPNSIKISDLTFDNITECIEDFIQLYVKTATENDESQKCFLLLYTIKDMELSDIEKITEFAQFIKNKRKDPEILAVHARTDVEQTPEGLQHDLDIMNDDKNWE